jgi:hypothetical protein
MIVDDPRQRLIELLTVLIAWRSGYSREYLGPALGPDREQHEIALLLEEHPALAAEESIRAAIDEARQAVAQALRAGIPLLWQYTLQELLVPPLTAFSPIGDRPDDVEFMHAGGWKELSLLGEDAEDIEGVEPARQDPLEEAAGLAMESLAASRLGTVVDSWWRKGEGQSRQVIEQWGMDFYWPKAHHNYYAAQCFYRYSILRPDDGLVYPSLENAVVRKGGMLLSEAMADGLAHGLVLPDESAG